MILEPASLHHSGGSRHQERHHGDAPGSSVRLHPHGCYAWSRLQGSTVLKGSVTFDLKLSPQKKRFVSKTTWLCVDKGRNLLLETEQKQSAQETLLRNKRSTLQMIYHQRVAEKTGRRRAGTCHNVSCFGLGQGSEVRGQGGLRMPPAQVGRDAIGTLIWCSAGASGIKVGLCLTMALQLSHMTRAPLTMIPARRPAPWLPECWLVSAGRLLLDTNKQKSVSLPDA